MQKTGIKKKKNYYGERVGTWGKEGGGEKKGMENTFLVIVKIDMH